MAFSNEQMAFANNGMAWSNNDMVYTQPTRRPYACWFLVAALILLGIAAIVLAIAIPLSLSTNGDSAAIGTYGQASPVNSTYLLGGPSGRSIFDGLDLGSIDKETVAQHFETVLNLSIKNVLHISNIYTDIAIGSGSTSRRKRSIQCNGDATGSSGPVLTFDFNITHPSGVPCQSPPCINATFAEVVAKLKSHTNFSIDFGSAVRALRLCAFGNVPSIATQTTLSTTQSPTTISSTQSFTTISNTQNISTVTSTTNVLSTNLAAVNVSTTVIAGTNVSTTTVSATGALTTGIAGTNVSTTTVSATGALTTDIANTTVSTTTVSATAALATDIAGTSSSTTTVSATAASATGNTS